MFTIFSFSITNLRESVYVAPPHKLSVLSYFCRFGGPRRRVQGANHDKRHPIEFVRSCQASARDPFRYRNGDRGRQNFLCIPSWQFPLDTERTIK